MAEPTSTGTGRTGTVPIALPGWDRLVAAPARVGPDPTRARSPRGALDAAALAAMIAVLGLGWAPVWGSNQYLRPTLLALVTGLAVAWLGARFRWRAISVLAATIVAYALIGGPAAAGQAAGAGFVPTASSLRILARGAVTGWKQIVTTVPPMHAFPELAVVPFLATLLTAVIAGTIAWRSRTAAWALAPIAAYFVAVALLGTAVAERPVLQGIVVGVVGLAWAGGRPTRARRPGVRSPASPAATAAMRRLRTRRLAIGAGMLAVGAVLAGGLAPGLVAVPRTALRDVVAPPLDLQDLTSPLAEFRALKKNRAQETLFTVTGLPAGARVRLAAVDAYDGEVYNVGTPTQGGGSYVRVGTEIRSRARGTHAAVGITVGTYDGVWIPTVGDLTGIDWGGPRAGELTGATYYDATTRSALTTAGLRPGDRYRLAVVTNPTPTDAQLRAAEPARAVVPRVSPDQLPATLAGKMTQFMGETTEPAERLFLLRDGLRASGLLSSGLADQQPSLPGHSTWRINKLLGEKRMVGDDEQFAVALALMANRAGIPARVVMGFYPSPGRAGPPARPCEVKGSDVHVWVEVPFRSYGWVPIDATPDDEHKVQPVPRTAKAPKPPTLQEPEPPAAPAPEPPGKLNDTPPPKPPAKAFDWAAFAVVVGAVGGPLLLVLLPVAAILAYKARRRSRRMRAELGADRLSGGWREIVDAAADLGRPVPAGATRREGAGLIASSFAVPAAATVAHRADIGVFGTADPTSQEAAEYWRDVDSVLRGMRSSQGWPTRLRGRISLRSIHRPARRRTIVARRRRREP